MKKNIIIYFCVLLLNIYGCSDKYAPPENLSADVYNLGMEILSVVDELLDMTITVDSAVAEVENLYIKFDYFDELNGWEFSLQVKSSILKSTLTSFRFKVNYIIRWGYDPTPETGATYDDILEGRNKLAEALKQPLRKK